MSTDPMTPVQIVTQWLADGGGPNTYPRERVQAAIEAVLALAQERQWQPIETYPPCDCGDPACKWGPQVLLRIPLDEPDTAYVFVGHKEAGEWLYRCPEDLVAWTAGERAPTHWQPLPPLPSNEQVR